MICDLRLISLIKTETKAPEPGSAGAIMKAGPLGKLLTLRTSPLRNSSLFKKS